MKDKEIGIKELSEKDAAKISNELALFNPKKCLGCGNKKNLVQRFFLLNLSIENEFVHKKVKKLLQDRYGLSYYGYSEKNKSLITTGKCPLCDGEKMYWDY